MDDALSAKQEDAIKKILEIMLSLPWQERPAVWSSVTHNDVFCVGCGIGSEQSPNPRCECDNDE